MIDQHHGLTVFASWTLEDGSQIHAARLDLSAEAAELASAELPASELARAATFALEQDRRRFVITRAGLRRLLAHYLDVPVSSLELTCEAEGKPRLGEAFAASGLRFNVSHTANIVAYAFAWNREIGIDVEEVRPMPNAAAIADRFFSRDERAEFDALAPEHRSVGFFRCWTRKEAIAKAIGTGLSAALQEFELSLETGALGQFAQVCRPNGERTSWQLHEFKLGETLIGACVVSTPSIPTGTPLSPEALGNTELALCF